MQNKVGIIVDNLGLSIRDGIVKAKELGVEGIQIYAVSGEMKPDNLSKKARKELLDFIKSEGLEVSALCGDFGGHGFQDAEENPWKIEESKKIIELAKDLETNIVTTHIGIVPEDKNCKVFNDMYQACTKLGDVAKEMDAYFAIETGPEPCERLKKFLDMLNGKRVGVNFDPANMVMVTGDDPVKGVYTLKEYIVHTHVKDGVRYKAIDPKDLYGYIGYESMSHEKISKMVTRGEFFKEVPIGTGKVDFNNYFKALEDIGYKGFLTIEREVKGDFMEGLKKEVDFIKGYTNK